MGAPFLRSWLNLQSARRCKTTNTIHITINNVSTKTCNGSEWSKFNHHTRYLLGNVSAVCSSECNNVDDDKLILVILGDSDDSDDFKEGILLLYSLSNEWKKSEMVHAEEVLSVAKR